MDDAECNNKHRLGLGATQRKEQSKGACGAMEGAPGWLSALSFETRRQRVSVTTAPPGLLLLVCLRHQWG